MLIDVFIIVLLFSTVKNALGNFHGLCHENHKKPFTEVLRILIFQLAVSWINFSRLNLSWTRLTSNLLHINQFFLTQLKAYHRLESALLKPACYWFVAD
jgi:hypothetical protein